MRRILIAGIGNIFLGDDAFGVEVAQQMSKRSLPPEVRVTDFGIRSYDLACALVDNYYAVILVDAVSRGQAPGTLFLIEPRLGEAGTSGADVLQDGLDPKEPEIWDAAENVPTGSLIDAHSMNPMHVLQMAAAMNGRPEWLYLVGCEPGTLECDDGRLGLSEPVRTVVPKAIEMIELLIRDLSTYESKKTAGLVSA